MSRFHIVNGEVKKCTATIKSCPVSDQHFNNIEDANNYFNKINSIVPSKLSKPSFNTVLTLLKNNFPDKKDEINTVNSIWKNNYNSNDVRASVYSFSEELKNKNNKNFYGYAVQKVYENFLQCSTNVVSMAGGRYFGAEIGNSDLQFFRDKFHSYLGDESNDMEKAKANRDRGYHYHLTVVSPPEMKQLDKNININSFPSRINVCPSGIGYAKDGDNEAYFVVCHSDEIDNWRKNHNLPLKDLHVTLGFNNKDVHTKSKNLDSLINNGLI